MPKRLKYQQRLDRYPPIFLRLVVTRGRGKARYTPTDAQLADASGLTMAQVKFVAYSIKWEGPVLAYLDRFLAGCEIDLEKRRHVRRLEWMRTKGQFTHLKRGPVWEQVAFREMLDLWVESS